MRHYKNIVLIAVIGFLVYANTLGNQFVYDDTEFISERSFIKSLSNIPQLFSPKTYFLATGEHYYWPVVTLSYIIDYRLWRLNVFGYHLTNPMFHLFNSILVYWLVLLLFKEKNLALLSGLIFAVHPVHTEAVSWVTGRKDVLVTFFIY